MYSILQETDASTSVTLSASGKFLPFPGHQLVTVGAKCLKFFRLIPAGAHHPASPSTSSSAHLECLLSFTLMAPVRSLAVVRVRAYPNCDSLALTFDDAKLSVVNVNPSTMTLNTLSLHSIEDEFLRDGYLGDLCKPELRTDPGNQCCAFTVYGRHLAIVPFPKTDTHGKWTGQMAGEGRQMLLQSYTIKLSLLDERLDNVLDMCFLHGYYEPTLLFLYEPIQTTAGRACVRFDTMAILAVSLNLKDRVHAVVWNFSGLPMSVDRCLPIVQPIGGVCLFGANEIIYLNQSVPPRGISLNSCAEEFSRFPLNDHHQSLRITLDGCAVQALNSPPNDILVVSREGELFILTLDTDQANVVRDMQLAKAFETSIPYTLTVLPNHVFIGSRLGDSQLLHFVYRQRRRSIQNSTSSFTMDNNYNSMVHFDQDDIFLYGREFCDNFFMDENEHNQVTRQYHFSLADTLPNVGPCKWLRACTATDISDVFQKKPRDIYFDMMTASGHGKDSSLCFFSRGIRPQIVTSTLLDETQQIMTMCQREDGTHKYLLISRERSTVVLELANDMVELDAPIFCQTESTIAAGDLADGAVAVQITPTSIVLAVDDSQLGILTVDSNFPVISASIEDPFISLLTLNGRFLLYQLVTAPQIALKQIPVLEVLRHEKSPITSLCLYKDLSGVVKFCNDVQAANESEEHRRERAQPPLSVDTRMFTRQSTTLNEDSVKKETQQNTMDVDPQSQSAVKSEEDVDAFLYGSPTKTVEASHETNGQQILDEEKTIIAEEQMDVDLDVQHSVQIVPSFWLFLVRENGNLYVFTVPELRLVYMVRKFNQAHEVLFNDAKSALDDELRPQRSSYMNTPVILPQPMESRSSDSTMVKPEEIVVELQVHGMGPDRSRPVLAALVDDMVIFYEMFRFDDRIPEHLAVRFRRLPHTVVTRASRFLGPNGRAPVEAVQDAQERHKPCIYSFEHVGQLSNGFFISGGYPSLLITGRGEFHLHPMTIDGPIDSFAQFNNQNFRNGFLYLTRKERFMRISILSPEIDYNASYPFRKVHIGQTIHHCVFMVQHDLVCLVLSEKRPNKKICTVQDEDKQIQTHERDPNFILPTIDFYTLKLFSLEDWKFVPNSDFQFEDFEVVTCCEEVLLSSESTVSGVKNFLALGTALNYGEEVYVRGRVIIAELIEVVPEEGMPTTRHRLKNIYDKEQKGPVTSLCAINGFLLTGMGQKIFIWQFRDNQLHGVSFLDMHFYIHHMVSYRDLALACDLYRSLSLIRYQEEFKALSLVSRDLRPAAPAPMTAHFLIDHKQLGFLLTDEMANLTMFNYLPETKESIGGERLIIRAAINIGSLINSIIRIKSHTSDCFVDPDHNKDTQTCFFATLDGSFGFVRPLIEKVFRRMHMLQQVMNLHVPQPAGLNPRGARSARPHKTGTNQQIGAAKNIVDGLLVLQYLYLSAQEKTDLARKLGTSRYQILDDLVELSRTVTHF